MMGYGYYDHMNGWGIAAAGIGSLLLWVALILGALALLRHLRGAPPTDVQRPELILGARYARGEIDDEEYHRRLDTLRHTGASATSAR